MDCMTAAAGERQRLRKPVGGFLFVRAYELLWVYAAFRANLLRWRDVRVWFACREALARRQRLAKGQSANYSLGELHGLVGGVGGEHLKASLRRLEAAGLLRFTEHAITFATSPDELRFDLSGFWTMVEDLGQKNRKVPIPRRTVRFIAGGLRKSVACTAIGHVLRCCYFRNGEYTAEGSCSASWVATLFGLDERSVKTGRKHLVNIGWLTVVESDHWHRQRHGGRAVVNPAWSRPVTVGEGGSETKPPPRFADLPTKPPPPLILNSELLTESKNQKPAPSGPAGVFNEGDESKKPPTMRHVEPEDLRDTTRTLELFEDAAKRGLVKASEADRLQFVAAAERAISVGTSNPPGLFVRIVRGKLWHHLTNDDEDAATRRLKRHFWGEPRGKREDSGLTRALPARPVLSADAKLVIAVKRVASQHRISCDPFLLLRREYPDWTRERWENAENELLVRPAMLGSSMDATQ